MSTNAWLVTGATGYIGKNVKDLFPSDSIFTYHTAPPAGVHRTTPLDLENQAEIWRQLDLHKPAGIIHLAALTNPSRNEANPQQAKIVNYQATRILAEYSASTNSPILFFSTDKVFDGSIANPNEETPMSPSHLYGTLKSKCEAEIRAKCKKYLILRLPIVHTLDVQTGTSLLDEMVQKLYRGEVVEVFNNVYRSFLLIEDLRKVIRIVLSQSIYGVYHLGSSVASYEERIRKVAHYLGLLKDNLIVGIPADVHPKRQEFCTNLAQEKLKISFW